jgi:hypothetical protein
MPCACDESSRAALGDDLAKAAKIAKAAKGWVGGKR